VLWLLPGLGKARGQTVDDPTLAEMLAEAPRLLGAAPAKYSTPFLVTRVVPKPADGDTCYVEVVTNGTSYDLFADGLAACRHLPALHAIVWGARDSRLSKDSIELVFTSQGERVKADTYFVRRSTPIPPDWKEDQ